MESIERTIHFQQIQRRIEFTPGTVLGSYRILRKIGAGGMGAVYEVEHVMLHQRFALKTLFVQGETETERQDSIDRFLQEARITSQLRHPGIVSVQTLEQDKESGALYFVMDYVSMTRRRRKDLLHSAFAIDATAWRVAAQVEAPGDRVTLSLEDLYQYGKRIGRHMNPELVRKLMMDVAQALHYAHNLGSGIIHRDIKPANILIQEDGHAVLADFGVAKIADSVLRKSVLRGNDRSLSLRMEAGGEAYHLVLGTVEYMAPELRSGSPPSPQTDLYALGATLYQLLTGELPSGNTLVPSDYGLDPLWNDIIKRCLAVDADNRFPTLQDLNLALTDFPKTVQARKVKRIAIWSLGAVAALLVLAIPSLLLMSKPAKRRPPQEGIWIPCPTPKIAFQFIEYSDYAVLHSAHPDLCGRVEIPSHFNGKPVTEITAGAFQSCTYANGFYVPVSVKKVGEELVPMQKDVSCPKPECLACKLRRSMFAQVPANTLPYARSTLSTLAQSTDIRAGENFLRGATVIHENVSYTLDEHGWLATSLTGPAPDHLAFPDTIGDEIIYKIGDGFCGQNKIRRVTFPRNLREIGSEAFSNVGLTDELRFPETLTVIRRAAFAHNRAVTKIVLPPNLEVLEQSTFQNTSALAAVTLPDTLVHLGDRAFCGTVLDQTTFRFPEKVKTLDSRHFWFLGENIRQFEFPSVSHCQTKCADFQGTGRQKMTLSFEQPEVTIETRAFRIYRRLQPHVTLQFREGAKVTLHADFIYEDTLPMEKFYGGPYQLTVRIGDKESVWDGKQFVGEAEFVYAGRKTTTSTLAPFTREGTAFIRLNDKSLKSFTVPEGIKRIRTEAFLESACESLTLPETVTTLETAAFKGMRKLKTITLPASIDWQASQYDWLFDQCESLERVIINSPLPTWQLGMFAKCRKLKYVVLAGNQSREPTFSGRPMWDEDNLSKPIHVIHVTRNNPKQKNTQLQRLHILKLQRGLNKYATVEKAVAQSFETIAQGYNTLANRPDLLSYLIPALENYFQTGNAISAAQASTSPITPSSTATIQPTLKETDDPFDAPDELPSIDEVVEADTPEAEDVETSPPTTRDIAQSQKTEGKTKTLSLDKINAKAESGEALVRMNNFMVRTTASELRIVKCLRSDGSITLPQGDAGQKVIVEADAFANCRLLILEVLSRDVVFKEYAFRNASIKNILFFDNAPLFTAHAFTGLRGDLPDCQVYTNGSYVPALITVRSMKMLRPNPTENRLYLFDYPNPNATRLSIPAFFTHERRRYKLYLLPGCFKNCQRVEHITLFAPSWTSPEVFTRIPTLSEIVVPKAHQAEAKALRKDLEGSSISVQTK